MSGNVPTDNSNARQAVAALEMLSQASPLNATLQTALAAAYQVAGEPQNAARARVIAQALTERNAMLLCDMATAYLDHAQIAQAEHWYRITLAIDPELAVAHQNLASVLRRQGKPEEADEHLKRAYSRQAVFVEPGGEGASRVLLLCAGSVGNIPIKHLMPNGRYTQIRYFVEYVKDFELASVPGHDVVFNVIGDPDASASEHTNLDTLLACTNRRVLNLPAHVAHTRRDRLPALLADIEGAVVPATIRIELTTGQSLADAVDRHGLTYPIIVRPAASHGGQGMSLAKSRAELETHALASVPVVYATAYHDYRSADGHFRKYRVIFVDREPYPYHLAISQNWLVHYFSADMLKEPAKLEEERRFLENPQAVLGARAIRILREIAQRLALDYAGIDFSVLPSGDLLVFEANATMLVHPEATTSPLAHKNGYVQAIIEAFGAMVDRRTAS